MISKNKLKYYSSLLHKKYRDKEGKFLAEGKKIIYEALKSGFNPEVILYTKEFSEGEEDFMSISQMKLEQVKADEIRKLTDTVTTQGLVAVFNKPKFIFDDNFKPNSNIIILIDRVTDPGNLGTIFRNCDWFGINEVLISINSSDVYNPKTIRASMGSIFHLKIFNEIIPEEILPKLKDMNYQILCADISGENIFKMDFAKKSVIIFSSEAHGPSKGVLSNADLRITIPRFGNAESLNVAAASAVILAEMKRRFNKT